MDYEEIINILKGSKGLIQDRYGVIDIAIFGSLVKNNRHAESDIDIFVDFKDGFISFDNYMDLKFLLEELTRCKVDLLIKDDIRIELRAKILQEAVHV